MPPLSFIIASILICCAHAVVEVSTSGELLVALQSAASGDVVAVQAGSYSRVCGIQINKSVTITGIGGEARFDCDGQAPQMIVNGVGVHVQLSNLGFIKGFSNANGGCLSVSGGASLDVNSCSFFECVSEEYGGGIYLEDSANANLRDTTFSDCMANQGGAVGVEGSEASVTMDGCKVVNNTAVEGGGVLIESSTLNIQGPTLFQGNIAVRGGGIAAKLKYNSTDPCAISIASGAVFEENVVEQDAENNMGAQGGAIHFVGLGSIVASAPIFDSNEAPSPASEGGAIYMYGAVTFIVTGEARITRNSASSGGAMWVGGGAHVEFRSGPVISHNMGAESGGALFATGMGTTLHLEDHVRVEHNVAPLAGAILLAQGPTLNLFHDVDVSFNRAAQYGGAILLYFLNTVQTRGSVRIHGNQAGGGGGLFLFRFCTAILGEGTSVSQNGGFQGGGVYMNNDAVLTADKVDFTDNAAPSYPGASGGAVHCEGCRMQISSCYFARNFAPTAAALSWKGGGSCTGSRFEHNQAEVGGAVGHFSEEALTLDSNTFVNNSAARDGGCVLSADLSVMHVSNSSFSGCSAGNNGAALFVKDQASVFLAGMVSMQRGAAGGTGGAVHHQGKLLQVLHGASVTVQANSARGGGGISTTAEIKVQGQLRVVDNLAREGDGGGVQAVGVYSVNTVSEGAWLEVAGNEATHANGGGIALLDNARLALALSACPASCSALGNGICDPQCLSPQCGWDSGECADRFLDAGTQAAMPCDRNLGGCPFWSIVDTSKVCVGGCISSSCDWGFGSVPCAGAVGAVGECPYLTALAYKSVTANDDIRYIKEGGTVGGYGRCESDTCSPADPSIGRDEPYCTTVNDGGRIFALDCPECTAAHETGEEAWGPCADKEKPRLPHVGFDYDPDELIAIADMDIPSVLSNFPGCGNKPIAIRANRAALAGGGVYKDRCDPFLESADRCFVGELDNQRLPSTLIDIADNHAGGPGGGIFVQCREMSACLRVMQAHTGLPEHGNASQRLIHFGDDSAADAYGRHAAGLPVELQVPGPARNYTPGQSLIDLSFRLFDAQEQILQGSAAWPNPHVVEVTVCRVGEACRGSEALQPPFLLRSHATDPETLILSAMETLAVCPVGDNHVEIHLQVAGEDFPGLHKSLVVGCEPCGPGQEMILEGEGAEQVWTCRSCQPSEYVISPLGGCQPCPLEGASCDGESLTSEVEGAEWVVVDATMRVATCPPGYILVRNPDKPVLDACVMCPPGKFNIQTARYPDTLAVHHASDTPLMCSECVRGADCLGGADIVSLPGFWEDTQARRASDEEEEAARVVLYQCSPRACEGNNTCSDGRHGAVCGLCVEGWSKSGLDCVHCGDEALGKPQHIPSFVVTMVGGVIFIYFLTWRPLLEDYERVITARICCSSSEKDDAEEHRNEVPTSRLRALRRYFAHIHWTSPAMIGAFKVAVSFYQVASTFNITFRIDWPASFDLIFSIGRLTGLDLTLLLPSVACVARQYSYVQRLVLFTAVFPMCITAFLCLPYILTRLLGVLYHGGSKAHPKHDNVQRYCLRAVLLWFFLIYPTVSEHSLATFLCQDLGSGGHVLTMDASVACPWGGSSPTGGFYFALFLVLLYPVGIPAFFYYVVSSFFVPAMAEAKYRRALFSELIKLYRRETSTPVTMQLAHHFGVVRRENDRAPSPSGRPSTTPAASTAPTRASSDASEVVEETAVPLRSFKRRVSQLFTKSFVQRELSGAVPEPALYDKLRHVLEQFGCSDEDLVRVVTVLQRLSITTTVSEELDGFEQLALKIAHNHFLFTGHETLDDLSMEQLKALFLFDWEGLNRKRSDREIRKRKSRRQHALSRMDREQLRKWVFGKAKDLEKTSRITVPNLNWNGESEEEDRALGFVGFLFDDFRVQTWYFFLVGEFCKLVMTSVLVFIPGHFWQQLAWGFFVQICITALYVVYRPMAEQWLNDFQIYSLSLQSAILFFGVLLAFAGDQGLNSSFEPWADFLVILKWSLAFFPLFVMLLGKAAGVVDHLLKRLVQGPDADADEREPSCIERVLFPTATNSRVMLRKASISSEPSVGGPKLQRAMSDDESLGRLRSASVSNRLRTGSVDALLVSARTEEAASISELSPMTEAAQPPGGCLLAKLPAVAEASAEDKRPRPAPEDAGVVRLAGGPEANALEGESGEMLMMTELELSVVPTPRT